MLSPIRLLHSSLRLLIILGIASCDSGKPLQVGQEQPDPEEAEYTARMIDAIIDISHQRTGEDELVRRFNQVKTLACFDADFKVKKNLPEYLQEGVFAVERNFPAVLRFASATKMDDTEKDFRGLSIKLRGDGVEPIWGQPGEQDFLLNSYPVLFAANPRDFLAFIESIRDQKQWRYFVNPAHFYSLLVVLKGREKISNPLAIRYWSTTPYRYGYDSHKAVKYSVRPCDDTQPEIKIKSHANFLTEVMHQQIATGGACLNFMVQFQKDPETMPIENASRLWSEADSPFETVATITIEPGGTSAETRQQCEAMTFNPWQAHPAHQPLGGINRVRRAVYAEMGRFRTGENQ